MTTIPERERENECLGEREEEGSLSGRSEEELACDSWGSGHVRSNEMLPLGRVFILMLESRPHQDDDGKKKKKHKRVERRRSHELRREESNLVALSLI